jgi:hypothetical protein
MKHSIFLSLFAVSVIAMSTMEASAFVCARGVYRAGCVGTHGAVVVGRPIVHVHPVHVHPVGSAVVVVPRGVVVHRRRVY